MSKKKESSTPVEETTPEVEFEEGLGIQDPDEILKQLAVSEPKDNVDEVTKEEDEILESEEPEEKTEEEPKEEAEEEEPESEEEPSKEEEKPDQLSSELEAAKADAESWKKQYSDSVREFQTVLNPKIKELESLNETLEKERQEIAEVLRSDPELLDSFVRAANNPELSKVAEAPKAKMDKDEVMELFKETFGADAIAALQDAKTSRQQARFDAIDKFEEEHPGLTDEERVKLAQMAGSIETIQKVDLKSALDRAFIALYPDKAFEKKGKEIEEAAKINSIRNRESTMSRTAGGSSSNKPQGKITPQEQVAARKLGMTEEDYIKYKNND